MAKLIMTTRDAAEMLAISPREVRRLADEGILKPLPGFRKPLKFSWYQVQAWLKGSVPRTKRT